MTLFSNFLVPRGWEDLRCMVETQQSVPMNCSFFHPPFFSRVLFASTFQARLVMKCMSFSSVKTQTICTFSSLTRFGNVGRFPVIVFPVGHVTVDEVFRFSMYF